MTNRLVAASNRDKGGFTLMEVVLAIFMAGLLALGVTIGTGVSLNLSKRSRVSQTMHNLAVSKLEEFAGVDPVTLDNSDDLVESSVTTIGTTLTFRRVSDVTVNADQSRTVLVTVTSNGKVQPPAISYSATFVVVE